MNNTKDEIQHSHNHKDNWLEYLWKALGDERNYRRLDIFTQIAVGVLVAVGLSLAGRYVERQSYYSSLLDKYLASTEQLLIKDTLEWRKEMRDQQGSSSSAKPTPEEIKSSIDSLIRASTEQTIRSLSENDGVWWLKWFNHNIERRQLLINFLRNSRLGFKNEKGEETNGAFSPLLTGLDLSEVGKDCQLNPPRPDPRQLRGCGLDLQGVDLSRAILPKALLTQTNLRGATFSDADLREATLYSADLRETWFGQADLREAHLMGAKLKGAKLKGANLMGANLTVADLREVDLTGAIYSDGTKWPDGYDPQKSGALRIGPGTNLKGADLKGANLKGADLREADLKGADLKGADLDRADLMGADLTGADLTGAKGVELKGAKLCKTIGPDQIQNDRDCPPGAN